MNDWISRNLFLYRVKEPCGLCDWLHKPTNPLLRQVSQQKVITQGMSDSFLWRSISAARLEWTPDVIFFHSSLTIKQIWKHRSDHIMANKCITLSPDTYHGLSWIWRQLLSRVCCRDSVLQTWGSKMMFLTVIYLNIWEMHKLTDFIWSPEQILKKSVSLVLWSLTVSGKSSRISTDGCTLWQWW